jgi:hypothetical protein
VVPRGPSDEKEVAFSLFSRGTRLRDRGRVCRAGADRTQEPTPPPSDLQAPNQPVPVTMTCGEFKALLKDDKRTSGTAILWLDGYYSGRSGLTELPAGWLRTVSQGIGGSCAISVNERRTVLDVIGQLHREYGGPKLRGALALVVYRS